MRKARKWGMDVLRLGAAGLAISLFFLGSSDVRATVLQNRAVVPLTLQEIPTEQKGMVAWVVSYGAEQDLVQFEIQLNIVLPPPGTTQALSGTLRRRPGVYHANAFLADLLRIHGEDGISVETPHRDAVPFLARIAGAGLKPDSLVPGHFVEATDGTWMLLRVSLESKISDGWQIIIALSPETNEGALIPAGRRFAPGVLSVFGGLVGSE
ncbi:MAG: hypothetical protein HY560_05450 [Gemmatimonadetes bacterium]|nr:hypothetical protein [Gemmatimonadota bacterium]